MAKKLALFFALTTLILGYVVWRGWQSQQSLRSTFQNLQATNQSLANNAALLDQKLRNADSLLRVQIEASTVRLQKIETERLQVDGELASLIRNVAHTDSLRKVLIDDYLAKQGKH